MSRSIIQLGGQGVKYAIFFALCCLARDNRWRGSCRGIVSAHRDSETIRAERCSRQRCWNSEWRWPRRRGLWSAPNRLAARDSPQCGSPGGGGQRGEAVGARFVHVEKRNKPNQDDIQYWRGVDLDSPPFQCGNNGTPNLALSMED